MEGLFFFGEPDEAGAEEKWQASETKHEAVVEKKLSLRQLGVSIVLPVYSGAKGMCGLWWRKCKSSLRAYGIPVESWSLVVYNQALRGQPKERFWREYL
jgi:hypothetical protein